MEYMKYESGSKWYTKVVPPFLELSQKIILLTAAQLHPEANKTLCSDTFSVLLADNTQRNVITLACWP